MIAKDEKEPRASSYVPALGYHWLTPWYDAVVRATTRERRFKEALIAQARCEPGHQILDLGCGSGTLAIWIKQREPAAIVTGVDGDPAMLAVAVRKAAVGNVAVQFDRGLSYSLPYVDARFDVAVSSLFFHHLSWDDKARSARELFRVLKPGAALHVADWGRAGGALMRTLFLTIQALDGVANTRDNVSGRLIPLFEGAGFIEVSQRQAFSTVLGTLALYRAVRP